MMKAKKKNEMIIVILIMLLLVVVTTYFVEGRQGGISVLPLGDVFVNYIQSFYYYAIFFLVLALNRLVFRCQSL